MDLTWEYLVGAFWGPQCHEFGNIPCVVGLDHGEDRLTSG